MIERSAAWVIHQFTLINEVTEVVLFNTMTSHFLVASNCVQKLFKPPPLFIAAN